MIRSRHVVVPWLMLLPAIAHGDAYVPAAPDQIPGYFAQPMPCKIDHDGLTQVKCDGQLLEKKSLRELSILRNTIYARYGWDGYRKPWLRDYFHAQPWFKPNPKFSYKLLSDVDKKNAHIVAAREQSLTSTELTRMRDDLFAHHGKLWGDKFEFRLKNGKTVKACSPPKNVADDESEQDGDYEPNDCRYAKEKWFKPNPKFTEAELTADEKIELGLLARAMGEFALDSTQREKSASSLDRILKPEELRQLSLRDLRLLRNTIYA